MRKKVLTKKNFNGNGAGIGVCGLTWANNLEAFKKIEKPWVGTYCFANY